MLAVVCAWVGTLVFCGLFLALFRARIGVGVLLLIVTLIAAAVAGFCTLFKEVNDLRNKVEALENQQSEITPAQED